MDATRRQPLTQLDLKSVVRTYAEAPAEGYDAPGVVALPDLVVAEVRRTEAGWEVYGRPTTRPDSGQRTRVLCAGPDVEIVAQADEAAAIRSALADYLRRRPERDERDAGEARSSPDVEVLNLTEDALTLTVMVRGRAWRVTI